MFEWIIHKPSQKAQWNGWQAALVLQGDPAGISAKINLDRNETYKKKGNVCAARFNCEQHDQHVTMLPYSDNVNSWKQLAHSQTDLNTVISVYYTVTYTYTVYTVAVSIGAERFQCSRVLVSSGFNMLTVPMCLSSSPAGDICCFVSSFLPFHSFPTNSLLFSVEERFQSFICYMHREQVVGLSLISFLLWMMGSYMNVLYSINMREVLVVLYLKFSLFYFIFLWALLTGFKVGRTQLQKGDVTHTSVHQSGFSDRICFKCCRVVLFLPIKPAVQNLSVPLLSSETNYKH